MMSSKADKIKIIKSEILVNDDTVTKIQVEKKDTEDGDESKDDLKLEIENWDLDTKMKVEVKDNFLLSDNDGDAIYSGGARGGEPAPPPLHQFYFFKLTRHIY